MEDENKAQFPNTSCLQRYKIIFGLGNFETERLCLMLKAFQTNHKPKLLDLGFQSQPEEDEENKSVALIKMGWSSSRKQKKQERKNAITEMDSKVYLEPFSLFGSASRAKRAEENDRFTNDRSGMSRRYDNRHPFSNVE